MNLARPPQVTGLPPSLLSLLLSGSHSPVLSRFLWEHRRLLSWCSGNEPPRVRRGPWSLALLGTRRVSSLSLRMGVVLWARDSSRSLLSGLAPRLRGGL